jgi:parvulin-like peptidyl-prolyl isomerase
LDLVKKKVEKPQRDFTKRQLSQWQKQRRKQRIILGFGIFIIVVVLGIVGVGIYTGWYIAEYKPLRQTVINVNDTEYNMDYYIKTLKVYGEGQPSYIMYYLADEVVRFIEQNELMRHGAMELGISISSDEVNGKLKSLGLPLEQPYKDIVGAELLVKKLLDEYFELEVPVSAEQRHTMAMLLESESQAIEVRARLEDGESFADIAGELSVEGVSKNEEGDLGWHPRDILTVMLGTSIPEEYAFESGVGVLSQPLYDETITKEIGYWLIKVLEREEESGDAHIQAILLGSQEEAQEVTAILEASEDYDKDFADLAKELSQHDASKEDGGNLDWLPPGVMSSAFDEFAFNAEIELGTLSEPIRDDTVITKGGYWLLEVVDEDEDRQIEDDDRASLKGKLLEEWVSGLWDDPENKVESYLDDEKKGWAVERAIGG